MLFWYCSKLWVERFIVYIHESFNPIVNFKLDYSKVPTHFYTVIIILIKIILSQLVNGK